MITRPTIEVGDFTYYNDENHAAEFESRNVRYHFDFVGDRLKIGKFCALAQGTTFIMSGANHAMTGFSTYPFNIFHNGWEQGFDPATIFEHLKGDTIVGHDVWFGTNATVMPGVTICSGAIIGAHAVVASDVPPYAVVVGNPARVVKLRFDEATIERLLEIAWWDWPAETISRNSMRSAARISRPWRPQRQGWAVSVMPNETAPDPNGPAVRTKTCKASLS